MIYRVILWLFVLSSVLSGCEKATDRSASDIDRSIPAYGDTYIEASIGEPNNLLPVLASDSASSSINALVYNGLIRYDKDFNWEGELAESWGQALEATLERAAARLSHFLLQAIFNLPALILLVLAGWRTTRDFISGSYMPANFFLHAFVTFGIVLLLSFFILQAIIRIAAGPRRLAKTAFHLVRKKLDQDQHLQQDRISRQIDAFLRQRLQNRFGLIGRHDFIFEALQQDDRSIKSVQVIAGRAFAIKVLLFRIATDQSIQITRLELVRVACQ